MWRTKDGSTGRLIQLCLGYFVFYVITGVTVKYFLGPAERGLPGMEGIEFLVYSTVGGTSIGVGVVLALRWYRLQSNRYIELGGGNRIPSELLYIIPSGVCTAVVIPTTTLMYTLPISVMVAMVIMRGSVIVISRVVDAIQIRQGILDKTVYWQENVAVAFALGAVGVHLVWASSFAEGNNFDFVGNAVAMTILSSYIAAYSVRIYIMNYYKNTRPKTAKSDNRGFFGVEQLAAAVTLFVVAVFVYFSPALFGVHGERVLTFIRAIDAPKPDWVPAIFAGMAFGVVAFFSVFIFMYKGRTATFAGLVNRLTSLIAGTVATLVFFVGYQGKFPETEDWLSLGFILVAVGFLTNAERRRASELAARREIEADDAVEDAPIVTPEKA